MSFCILILSLAAFGASASPCGGIVGLNTCASSCGAPLPGPTTFAQAPLIENPTRVIPPCVPTTSVSQSCHCMKTIVRPQIRNEIITAPSVDRIVRYVTSPVVEVSSVNFGGNTRTGVIPTCGVNSGISSGVVGGAFPGTMGYNGIVGSGLVNSGIVGSSGLVNSGIVGSGLVGSGIVGSGLVNSGIVGSGLVNSGIVGSGLVNSGIVGSGLVNSGIVGSGLVGSGIVGSGLVNSGIVGTGLVGGVVGSCGCGSNIVA